MTSLALSDNFTKYKTITCIKHYLPLYTRIFDLWAQAYARNNYKIMGVFLSISTIINPDAVPKNRCGRWTGMKELIMLALCTKPYYLANEALIRSTYVHAGTYIF